MRDVRIDFDFYHCWLSSVNHGNSQEHAQIPNLLCGVFLEYNVGS